MQYQNYTHDPVVFILKDRAVRFGNNVGERESVCFLTVDIDTRKYLSQTVARCLTQLSAHINLNLINTLIINDLEVFVSYWALTGDTLKIFVSRLSTSLTRRAS